MSCFSTPACGISTWPSATLGLLMSLIPGPCNAWRPWSRPRGPIPSRLMRYGTKSTPSCHTRTRRRYISTRMQVPRQRRSRHATGASARPAYDLHVRPMPLVAADETRYRKGLSVDELLSLGDAPVLPAGGGATRARLPGRDPDEHCRGAAGDPTRPGDRCGAGL